MIYWQGRERSIQKTAKNCFKTRFSCVNDGCHKKIYTKYSENLIKNRFSYRGQLLEKISVKVG